MSFASDLLVLDISCSLRQASHDFQDGLEVLYKRTDGVLKSCTEISDFYKQLARVERDYAKSLIKLAQQQKKDFQKMSPVQKEQPYVLLV